MRKNVIKLNENTLHRVIKESVYKVLKEQLEPIDADDFIPYFLEKIEGISIEKLWMSVRNNLINRDCLLLMQSILDELNIDWQKDVYGDDEDDYIEDIDYDSVIKKTHTL